jgi:hypothetical protein
MLTRIPCAALEDTGEVDGDRRRPRIRIERVDGSVGNELGACIRDHHVEAGPRRRRAFHRAGDLRLVHDIRRDGDRVAGGGLDFLDCCVEHVSVGVDRIDTRPLRREPDRGRATDARAGAGDEGTLPVESSSYRAASFRGRRRRGGRKSSVERVNDSM